MSQNPSPFLPVSEINFRRAKFPKDLPFLASVFKSTRVHEFEPLIDWDDQKIDAFLQMQFEMQHNYYQKEYAEAEYLIIKLGDTKVGRLYKDYREDEIRVIDIALLTEFRAQGTGGKIMEDIIHEASGMNKKVRIHVERNNPAQKLYDRLGFKLIKPGDVYNLLEWGK
ncbi:hypothetical protein GCM10028791_23460 [Echinicola sediminis]